MPEEGFFRKLDSRLKRSTTYVPLNATYDQINAVIEELDCTEQQKEQIRELLESTYQTFLTILLNGAAINQATGEIYNVDFSTLDEFFQQAFQANVSIARQSSKFRNLIGLPPMADARMNIVLLKPNAFNHPVEPNYIKSTFREFINVFEKYFRNKLKELGLYEIDGILGSETTVTNMLFRAIQELKNTDGEA